jgi:hypothetical protein
LGSSFQLGYWKGFPLCLLKQLHNVVAEVSSSVSSGETVALGQHHMGPTWAHLEIGS